MSEYGDVVGPEWLSTTGPGWSVRVRMVPSRGVELAAESQQYAGTLYIGLSTAEAMKIGADLMDRVAAYAADEADGFDIQPTADLVNEVRAAAAAARAEGLVHCDARHEEDLRPCVGAMDAVRIQDKAGTDTPACVLHGAVLLASLTDGRVYPGQRTFTGPGDVPPGAAVAVYKLAQELPPFAWSGDQAAARAAELLAGS